ncbi:Eukaryotic translation initiation factor 4E type 3-A [Neolecta irregularis DAH-3]|uniref:Eukaryotic translation initiation factor 4E type 3-A n=1 Tax=Neolecta irregularis (strain DAH-3) TaxID=1198029 RepID=A0A1U7LJW4_NEOID|nr:Eukaryotic translation initiation factor 4E type 3-A [Neolecta irregularis DAH-3]|eukprot:OLL22950.1 Eukaryotic translation initiation factor 4E type 3-A [Neolecta irregularis DAH-3]
MMTSRQDLKLAMLKKLRPLPIKHEWKYWHVSDESSNWEDTLKEIAMVNTVQLFWQVFNNLPLNIPIKNSIHFFKNNVKPLWEDPRNEKGGCWNFRLPKSAAPDFFREILMLLIGEQLQDVVLKGDDICGCSYSMRFNSTIISVWNRDASNQVSVQNIFNRINDTIPSELWPTAVFYKPHSHHTAFKADQGASNPSSTAGTS